MLLGRTGDTRGYLRDVTVVHAAVLTGATYKLQQVGAGVQARKASSRTVFVVLRVFSGLGEQSPKRKTAT